MADTVDKQWRRKDREEWIEYKKWENRNFPLDNDNPFKDPRGMIEARRAFEKQQIKERLKFFKAACYGGRE